MIVTVTMNPAIDKTVDLEEMQLGELNRIQKVELDAGGKGINVSKTIQALGGQSIALGFAGGSTGMMLEDMLRSQDIKTDFVKVQGNTRTNMKVVEQSGRVTELNEAGPVVTETELEALLEKMLEYANEDTLFVLAGSVPRGVPIHIYGRMIEAVHKKGAKVLMDADGPLFAEALKAVPDMIKPNHIELAAYYGLKHEPNQAEVIALGQRLLEMGVNLVVISQGSRGADFFAKNQLTHCEGLSVKAHSTVGAGDAMVAGMAYSWERKLNWNQMIADCMAVSAGAVTTVGTKPPDRALIEKLKQQVVMRELA
ncbi:MAG: 1-phosphofructokinase [Lachnospiraceae bacterium]